MRYWHAVVLLLCGLLVLNGCGETENKNIVKAKSLIAEGKQSAALQEIEAALASEPEHAEALSVKVVLQALSGGVQWPTAVQQIAQHMQPVLDKIGVLEAKEDPDDDDYKQLDVLVIQRNYTLGLLATSLSEALQKDAALAEKLPEEFTTRLMLEASRSFVPEDAQAAVQVTALVGSRQTLEALARSSEQHPSVRAQAVELLIPYGVESLPALEAIAAEKYLPLPVAYSLTIVSSHLPGRTAVPLLRRLMEVEIVQTRMQAVAALNRLRDVESIPHLIDRLADNSSFVRAQAAAALSSIGAVSINPLLQVLADGAANVTLPPSALISVDDAAERRDSVQTEAMNILAALKAEEAVSVFVEMLEDPDLGGSAESALGSMGAIAVPALISLLQTGDDSQRITASELLAGSGDLRAVDALTQALADPHKDVRANAAQGLGSMKARGEDNRAVEALIAALDSDERTQTNAIAALQNIGVANDTIDAQLVASIDSRTERQGVRLAAIAAAGALKSEEATMPLVRILLADSENDAMRKSAATALGEIKHADVTPALIWIAGTLKEDIKDFQREMKRRYSTIDRFNEGIRDLFEGQLAPLKDSYESYDNWNELKPIPSLVRSEVMVSLGKIKGDEVIDPLIKVLEDDQRAAVRAAAAWALGEIGGQKVIDPLIHALKKDKQGIVRSLAAEALGKIKGEKVIDPLIATLKHDKFENARLKTAIGLREVKFDRAARGLASALKGEGDAYEEKEVNTVLNEIMIALQKDGAVAVPALLTAVDSEDVMVRKRAIDGLGIIADKSAYDALVKALDDESVVVRERAAARLGALKERKAVSRLIEVLNDEEEWVAVRASAAASLGTLRDARSADVLLGYLDSPEPLLRSAAVSALGSLRDKRALPTLRAIALNVAEEVTLRQGAVSALASIGDTSVGSELLGLLDMEQGALYNAVVSALGTLKVAEAAPRLNAILTDPTEAEAARRNAAGALAKIADSHSAGALATILADPSEYRISVIDSIKRNLLFEDVANASRRFTLPTSVIPRMMLRIDDAWEHKTVHWASAIALSRTFDEQALARVVMAAQEDAEVDVRNIASRSLGETGRRQYAQMLIAIATDEEKAHGHRRGAIRGLGFLGDPSGVQPLIGILTDTAQHEERRRDAAIALGRLGTPEAVAVLEQTLGQAGTSRALKLDILTGIKEAKSSTSVSVLKSLLEDGDSDIHFKAVDALYAITGDAQEYHWM